MSFPSPSTIDGSTSYVEERVERALQRANAVEGWLWAVMIFLMAADLALTAYGLHLGLRELNPVAVYALERAGLYGLGILKTVVLLLGVCYWLVLPTRLRPLVPLGYSVPLIVAVCVNTTLIWTLLA